MPKGWEVTKGQEFGATRKGVIVDESHTSKKKFDFGV